MYMYMYIVFGDNFDFDFDFGFDSNWMHFNPITVFSSHRSGSFLQEEFYFYFRVSLLFFIIFSIPHCPTTTCNKQTTSADRKERRGESFFGNIKTRSTYRLPPTQLGEKA